MRITSYMVSFGYAAFRQRVGERGGRERGKHIPRTVSFKEAEVVCIIKSCSGCKLHLITGLSGRERERRGEETDRRGETERSRAIEGDRESNTWLCFNKLRQAKQNQSKLYMRLRIGSETGGLRIELAQAQAQAPT